MLLFGLRLLVAWIALVQGILGESGVHCSDTPSGLDLVHAFDFAFLVADDFHRVNLVELVELAHAPLHQLDQDEGLDNCVASCPDCQAPVVSFVQDSECVPKVVLDCALGCHANLVFSGRVLVPDFAALAGLLGFLFVCLTWLVLFLGLGIRGVGIRISRFRCLWLCTGSSRHVVGTLVRFFVSVRRCNSVAHLEYSYQYPHKLLNLKRMNYRSNNSTFSKGYLTN